jgi:hypothetical protein
MADLRQAAQQAIADICAARLCEVNSMSSRQEMLRLMIQATDTLRAALAQEEQGPVAWTDRELQLIDGMIEVQLRHAAQCDGIANRTMAEKQKGWDMERVALLHKIKSISPRREWQSLSEEEIHDCFQQRHKDKATERRMIARAVEQALRSKNQ